MPAESWPEAVAKTRYVLNLYSASLSPTDTHYRDLVAAVLADLTRLAVETSPDEYALDVPLASLVSS
ncbi:MAG: hypothetical protein ACRETL_01360 [Gammaproteobacteria bacterium]